MAQIAGRLDREPWDRWDIAPVAALFCSVVLLLWFSTASASSGFVRSRGGSSPEKSCVANLKQIEAEYAGTHHLPVGAALPEGCLWAAGGFIKTQPECPSGGTYTVGGVGETPQCSLGGKHSLD